MKAMKKVARRQIERVESGISGFDRILQGGLLRGGLYMVRGAPGSGKTILGNQVCSSAEALLAGRKPEPPPVAVAEATIVRKARRKSRSTR